MITCGDEIGNFVGVEMRLTGCCFWEVAREGQDDIVPIGQPVTRQIGQ